MIEVRTLDLDNDEPSNTPDEFKLLEAALEVFKAADIGRSGPDENWHVALLNGEVIGATASAVYYQHHINGHPGEDLNIYDFDIAVHPKHQRGVVGYLLIAENMRLARMSGADAVHLWVINEMATRMLVHHFDFTLDSERKHVNEEDEVRRFPPYSARLTKWLRPYIPPLHRPQELPVTELEFAS